MHQSVVSHGRPWIDIRTLYLTPKLKPQKTQRASKNLTSRIANNMHHRHELSISASMAAISTELARPESRHESPSAAGAFDTAV